jgi:hypothetical protein
VSGTMDSASPQPTHGIVLPFGHMGLEARHVHAPYRTVAKMIR